MMRLPFRSDALRRPFTRPGRLPQVRWAVYAQTNAVVRDELGHAIWPGFSVSALRAIKEALDGRNWEPIILMRGSR